MTQVFRGDLLLPGEDDGLVADVKVDGDELRLETGDELLGVWRDGEYRVDVERAGEFRLALGGEQVVFKPESPSSFAAAMAVPLQPPTESKPTRAERKAGRRQERAAAVPDVVEEYDLIAQVRPVRDLTTDDDFISPALMRTIVVLSAVVVTVALVVIGFV
ncbi:MAG TPA: hypothetical protein ENK55_08900 [Actinobacteria bacterium]|nr:hypothetical protein [Actinomycetota bacterium]